GTKRFRNSASSDEPRTTSGVAIGRKISRLVVARPRKRYRTSENAINVPRMVDTMVTIRPTHNEFTTDGHTSGAPHGFSQLSKVKLFQTMFVRPASLNENANV